MNHIHFSNSTLHHTPGVGGRAIIKPVVGGCRVGEGQNGGVGGQLLVCVGLSARGEVPIDSWFWNTCDEDFLIFFNVFFFPTRFWIFGFRSFIRF